ncbi:response regulator transcription factor [Haloarcula japonica]|uniref:response regulator transcription factor n=1 Tax=Haloarcula japonica TaxID=29282 RepID=UPI0039F68311
MTQSCAQPVVLVVEDETDIADSYELWLNNAYEVYRAETGEVALSRLDDLAVDVVLLDRMLPGISGDEVLDEIRKQGYRCRVAMVSAVQPGIDVVEMGFDGYITKPPDKEEL